MSLRDDVWNACHELEWPTLFSDFCRGFEECDSAEIRTILLDLEAAGHLRLRYARSENTPSEHTEIDLIVPPSWV